VAVIATDALVMLLRLPAPQISDHVMRSFVAKSFQRIMPPVMIGVIFVLEVAWILFLVYAFVRFALPGRWAHVILGAGTSAR
jgi:hypothetical protein